MDQTETRPVSDPLSFIVGLARLLILSTLAVYFRYFPPQLSMAKNQHSKVTVRLFEAMELAFQLHGRDARKSTAVPMMTHLYSVCGLVMHDGGDEDEAIGALLHDALEDKPELITLAEIERRFGPRVASIVRVSSDTPEDFKGGKKPPWRERKMTYLQHIQESNPDLLRVTMADKVDNVRAILADYGLAGEQLWDRFNAGKEDQLWYYESVLQAYQNAGCESALLNELETSVTKLRLLIMNKYDSSGKIL